MPAIKITKEMRCYREIKAAMALQDMTCEKLAKRVGAKSGQRVSDWRKNIYRVTPDKILLMSDALHLDIFDVMKKILEGGKSVNKGITVETKPLSCRTLKMLMTDGDPVDLIDEMINDLTKDIKFNKHDLIFWTLALENLAAAFKSGFSAAENITYQLLKNKIKAEVSHVYVSKDGFKEGFDGDDN